jgi:hypothetical protein
MGMATSCKEASRRVAVTITSSSAASAAIAETGVKPRVDAARMAAVCVIGFRIRELDFLADEIECDNKFVLKV